MRAYTFDHIEHFMQSKQMSDWSFFINTNINWMFAFAGFSSVLQNRRKLLIVCSMGDRDKQLISLWFQIFSAMLIHLVGEAFDTTKHIADRFVLVNFKWRLIYLCLCLFVLLLLLRWRCYSFIFSNSLKWNLKLVRNIQSFIALHFNIILFM